VTNILTDKFPKSLKIANEEYAINWGHRDCLKILLELEKNDLTPSEQYVYTIEALYVEVPEYSSEAIEKALWFLHGGNSLEEAVNEADNVRTYSYEVDSSLIYAAFSTRHGIDLAETTLHWWRFRALFTDLRETTFSELCNLRKRYHDGDCTPNELEAIGEMGSSFHLDGMESDLTLEEEENIAAFEAAEMESTNG